MKKEDLHRKVYLRTSTKLCEINHHQTTEVQDFLQQNGYELVDDPDEATDILVMTCGALRSSEERSLQVLGDLVDRSPEKNLFVMGCLPRIHPGLPILSRPELEVIGPDELHRIEEWFPARKHYQDVNTAKIDHELVDVPDVHPNRFTLVPVQGCVLACSFCAIKKAKRRIQSQPEEKIIERVRQICAEHDNPTIALLGEDFGSYGLDRKTDAVALLDKLTTLPGEFSIEIQNFEPTRFLKLFDRLKPVLLRGRVTKLHVAVQSGSQRVLRDMRRPYDVDAIMDALMEVVRDVPECMLEGSFIINYPTEERIDFMQTLPLLPEFDEVVVFDYSARPGTPAAALKELPLAEKQARIGFIKQLQTVHPGLHLISANAEEQVV